MILIFSNSSDFSTNTVIDWIVYFGERYHRINNNEEFISFISEFPSVSVAQLSVSSIWVRRYGSEFLSKELSSFDIKESDKNIIQNRIEQELNTIKDYFIGSFNNTVLGNYDLLGVNKLLIIKKAKQLKLKTPRTKILCSKKELLDFKKSVQWIITKPSFEPLTFFHPHFGRLGTYTEELTLEKIQELPDYFFPSLVQEKIEKLFEIRTFYLDGKFYSMAIFSQLDKQTSIDMRRYNVNTPNREVPYILDKEIRSKLKILMKFLNLNTGSFDLIKSTDGNIYFLEVNPVGQYASVSHSCNYYLDKKIAQFLIYGK